MATEAEIYPALTTIFRDVFLRDDLALTPELSAKDVQGWDSFKQIEIIMASEEAWKIRFFHAGTGRATLCRRSGPYDRVKKPAEGDTPSSPRAGSIAVSTAATGMNGCKSWPMNIKRAAPSTPNRGGRSPGQIPGSRPAGSNRPAGCHSVGSDRGPGELPFVARDLNLIVLAIAITDPLMHRQRGSVALGRRRFDQVEMTVCVLAPNQHRA